MALFCFHFHHHVLIEFSADSLAVLCCTHFLPEYVEYEALYAGTLSQASSLVFFACCLSHS